MVHVGIVDPQLSLDVVVAFCGDGCLDVLLNPGALIVLNQCEPAKNSPLLVAFSELCLDGSEELW